MSGMTLWTTRWVSTVDGSPRQFWTFSKVLAENHGKKIAEEHQTRGQVAPTFRCNEFVVRGKEDLVQLFNRNNVVIHG